VLSKARRRFGVTVYQAYFTEVVRQCVQAGLIAGDRLFADSTLVEANASRESVGSRALLDQLTDVDEHVAALWRDNHADADEPSRPVALHEEPHGASIESEGTPPVPTPASAASPADTVQSEVAGEDQPLRSPLTGPHLVGPEDQPNGPQGQTNELVRSRTDPDAGLVSRAGVPLNLYHKVHVGVDGGSARIITAVDVTPGDVADEYLLDRLRKEHEGTTGCMVREVVADAKYGTHDNYQTLEAAGIRASIPPHLGSDQHRAIPRDAFTYDPRADRFLCPHGHPLMRQGVSHTANTAGSIIYRASPKAFGPCPLREVCCGTAQARTISRPNDGGLADRVRAYLDTPHAKRSIRQRMCWAETPMAERKERHGLRRARCRGHTTVLVEALSAAIAYNIKKLARCRGTRRSSSAPSVSCQCRPRRRTRPLLP